MHPRDALMKHQGVGKDRGSHAASLLDIRHAQKPRDRRRYIGPVIRHLVKDSRRFIYTIFERVSRSVYGFLGNGHETDQVGQVGYGSLKPSRFGEAAMIFVVVKHSIR